MLLAAVLTTYQEQYRLDDTALAAQIGCSPEDVTHLKLCDVPRPDHFEEDIRRIADHVHADAALLMQILSERLIDE